MRVVGRPDSLWHQTTIPSHTLVGLTASAGPGSPGEARGVPPNLILYLATPVLDMCGHGFGILMAPLAVAEIVLAAWLIARGLDFSALRETTA